VTQSPTTVVWFRRDLRLSDNPALTAAVKRGRVLPCFLLDDALLARRHHEAPARLRFLRAGLEALDMDLGSCGSGLVVRRGRPADVLPKLAHEVGADRVVWAREVSPLGRERDAAVEAALATAGISSETFPGGLAVEPDDLPGPGGEGYRVFTPFHRAWLGISLASPLAPPKVITGPRVGSESLDVLPGGAPPLAAGSGAATKALADFVHSGASRAYDKTRNDPAGNGTSRLSAYLRLGMLSAGEIGAALGSSVTSGGAGAFWRQVAWRDFFHHILHHHPHVARGAMRPEFDRIEWDHSPPGFDAWRHGETGYPLVDAGMRQLAEEAWMHNRARLVTASFLVKDLLIDWRRGETWFMRQLVDGDPASNNGGWQWVAGTGSDAAPYFRVLNPTLQAQRFDPDGVYIRRYVPELRDVPDRFIHEPWRMSAEDQRAANCGIGSDYPAPIVDHGARRVEVLERYKAAQGSGGTGTGRPSSSTATRTK
jgi:deoxyribodipyrimidine photo-lyase